MKNINQLKQEIKQLENISSAEIAEMKPAVYKRHLKKMELLRHLVKYLETNPTKDFIEKDTTRLETVISAKMLEFPVDDYHKLAKKEVDKLRKEHESKYGIGKLRTQLKTLRYLLQ